MDEAEKLVAQINKECGDGTICLLGRNEKLSDIKVRSSGSLLLDLALGGGYARGRMVELSGFERSGKTSLLCLAIAEAQASEPEKECAILDLEHSFNPEWAKLLGVNIDRLFFAQPDIYAEKVFDLVEYLVSTGKFSIIGIDSLAGLVPRDEFEEEDWDKDSRVGGASKINAKAVRKIVNTGLLTKSETTLICINQLRDKIGTFSPYGVATDTPGGRALKYAFTQQLSVNIGDYFTSGSGKDKKYHGQQIKVKIVKNKIAPPYRTATIDILYDDGVDKLMELVIVAKEIHVLEGTNWLKFIDPRTGEIFRDKNGEEIKFNGIKKARDALLDDIEENNGVIYSKLNSIVQEILRR